mmetsp:Transcript_6958/g.16799  ORF Transcript_6958/g.16799 Transcript_6958/m.16799 type:complete len:208 (+) Transcript_6958:163-786(+)
MSRRMADCREGRGSHLFPMGRSFRSSMRIPPMVVRVLTSIVQLDGNWGTRDSLSSSESSRHSCPPSRCALTATCTLSPKHSEHSFRQSTLTSGMSRPSAPSPSPSRSVAWFHRWQFSTDTNEPSRVARAIFSRQYLSLRGMQPITALATSSSDWPSPSGPLPFSMYWSTSEYLPMSFPCPNCLSGLTTVNWITLVPFSPSLISRDRI